MSNIFLFILFIGGVVWADSLPTPETIMDRIKKDGPYLSFNELFKNENNFYYVMDHIAEADPKWLEVAALLEPGAQTHPGEELFNAIAQALAKKPEAVLSLPLKTLTVTDICFRQELIGDNIELHKNIEGLLHRLLEIKDPKLKEKCEICIKALKNMLHQIDSGKEIK